MANPSTAHEPSMEEILASIRQIISEDGEEEGSAASGAKRSSQELTAAGSKVSAVPPAPAGSGSEPVQKLQQGSGASDGGSAPASTAAPAKTARQEAQPSAKAAQPSAGKPVDLPAIDRHLLSERSDEVVSGAFSALAHTILAQNARTLEDLVTEMLRPMLKDWLDDNLPTLVERLVKEEIERVSRGRR